jgi:uncharacterized protein (TIGR03663 family)
VSTHSTKSARKKARARTGAAETEQAPQATEPAPANDIPDRAWMLGVIVIFVIAAILRIYDLDLVPLHHDEGVNGNFLVRLVREGNYRYDPENYHGPTLYYFSALIPWIIKVLFGAAARDKYGLTTFAIRFVTVVFGLGTIGLVFLLRRKLGTVATLAAGLLLAISPGSVYLSRYYIHEMLFVFFTLGIVVAGVWFYEYRNPSYLIPAAASASLLFATKETAFISVGVLIIALGLTLAYGRTRKRPVTAKGKKGRLLRESRATVGDMGGQTTILWNAGVALFVFVALWVLFYSSFFKNSQGLWDSIETFKIWTRTGFTAHKHPVDTYIWWLLMQEGAVLVLGAIGAAIVVLKPKNSVALFCALWAFGLIAAYSLIDYKTPWLMLNFVVPLALIAGYAIQTLYEFDGGRLRLVSLVMLGAIGVGTYQTIDLNFFNYDTDRKPYVYVYAHTTRPTLDLVKEIERIAKTEAGKQTGISIISPDYWPLPWYLRDYTRVGYFGRMAATTEPIVIANENQLVEMEANFGELYELVMSKEPEGSFELRPGVKLLLYHRRTGLAPPANPPSITNP